MAVKNFLFRCGMLFLILGLAGSIGLGPTPDASIFGSRLYFDPTETAIHFLLGAILVATYFIAKSELLQRSMVVVVAVLALVATVYGFLNAGATTPNIGWANFENPLENLLHFAIGLWGLWVAFMPEGPLFVPDEPSDEMV